MMAKEMDDSLKPSRLVAVEETPDGKGVSGIREPDSMDRGNLLGI
jgi:hypothetical protein